MDDLNSEHPTSAILIIELTKLRARHSKCGQFCLNHDLQIEAELLDAEIKALELLQKTLV